MLCTVHFTITLFNAGNVLLCVIYQLNFTAFIYVTRISRYITLYHVIYSVRYYPRFHVIAIGLGTYYPWIRRSVCMLLSFTETIILFSSVISELLILRS